MKVGLHGEPEIWCLYPKRLSYSLDFGGHSTLIPEGEEVLNDRIAKNHIYAAISKLGKIRCVTLERLDVSMLLFFCD